MTKKIILMVIAGVLVLTTMIGGTLAAFQANSSQGISNITTKDLDIFISDKGNTEETIDSKNYKSDVYKAMPGSKMDENLTIAFASSQNYDSYVRAIVYKAWGKTDADSVFQKSFDHSLDIQSIKIIPEKEEDWIIVNEDDETVVMYHKKPLSMEGIKETTKFIDEIAISMNLDNQYADKSFVIEASVDAVQAIGGSDAIKSAWGVTASLDGEGNITAVATD